MRSGATMMILDGAVVRGWCPWFCSQELKQVYQSQLQGFTLWLPILRNNHCPGSVGWGFIFSPFYPPLVDRSLFK